MLIQALIEHEAWRNTPYSALGRVIVDPDIAREVEIAEREFDKGIDFVNSKVTKGLDWREKIIFPSIISLKKRLEAAGEPAKLQTLSGIELISNVGKVPVMLDEGMRAVILRASMTAAGEFASIPWELVTNSVIDCYGRISNGLLREKGLAPVISRSMRQVILSANSPAPTLRQYLFS